MVEEVRTIVVQLFEKHRATPGAPYDESHFLDFLLPNPKSKRAVYDSFRGLRRFNAFLDEAQLELVFCFSIKDREASYSLDKFVARVIELQQSHRGSLAALQNQARTGPGWPVLIVADFILVMVAIALRENGLALAAVGMVALLVNIGFLLFALHSKTYRRRLLLMLGND